MCPSWQVTLWCGVKSRQQICFETVFLGKSMVKQCKDWGNKHAVRCNWKWKFHQNRWTINTTTLKYHYHYIKIIQTCSDLIKFDWFNWFTNNTNHFLEVTTSYRPIMNCPEHRAAAAPKWLPNHPVFARQPRLPPCEKGLKISGSNPPAQLPPHTTPPCHPFPLPAKCLHFTPSPIVPYTSLLPVLSGWLPVSHQNWPGVDLCWASCGANIVLSSANMPCSTFVSVHAGSKQVHIVHIGL